MSNTGQKRISTGTHIVSSKGKTYHYPCFTANRPGPDGRWTCRKFPFPEKNEAKRQAAWQKALAYAGTSDPNQPHPDPSAT